MMVVTTVNGEDDVPVCLDACSDTWEEEFFDNLGQEDQGKGARCRSNIVIGRYSTFP